MASEKILSEKKKIVEEIIGKLNNSESVIIFQYQGMTVEDLSSLRKELKTVNSDIKVYKNTLLKRAADELKLNLDEFLEGPNAICFGETLLEPIKMGAPRIIMVHNHPSGDATPSKADFIVTDRIYEASEIMGIQLLDHIIIGDGNFESIFAKKGLWN